MCQSQTSKVWLSVHIYWTSHERQKWAGDEKKQRAEKFTANLLRRRVHAADHHYILQDMSNNI